MATFACETTLSSENQRLKIVASGGTGRARQVITGLTIGNRYRFQVRHVTCASGNCFTHLGTSDGGSEILQSFGLGDEDLHVAYFTATTDLDIHNAYSITFLHAMYF